MQLRDSGLPNSDSANAVRHTSFSKVSDLFGKSEFANPLTDFYLGKMGCRIPIRQMPSGILFSKVSDLFGKCYGLPNSDSANAVRHTFLKVSDIIGKSEFANPLTDFYLVKMGCRTPIRQMP